MKVLIASDIHGSYYYAQKLIEKADKNKVDAIVLLGDLYYHGPRNPLPKDYAPMKVCELLNTKKDILRVIRGNCDAEVDQMISQFQFVNDLTFVSGDGIKFFFTHGHHLDEIPFEKGTNVVFYGHTHVFKVEKKDDILFINPGSVSIPRNDESRNYILLTDKDISILNLDTDEVRQTIEL